LPEVSAKLGTHVTAAFETLVDAIVIKWTKVSQWTKVGAGGSH
jgi:hypothetical protein